ncbi:MAG: lyso-ornithine lipid O-acyltransferase [Alkalilacustris sp.]
MSPTWHSAEPPPSAPARGVAGWARILGRGLLVGGVTFGGLAILLLLRGLERPLCGLRRPVTPWITVVVCRVAVWGLGLRVAVRGAPMRGRGAMVANHVSWLDIYVLNAQAPLYFVSKAEVARWPGVGWLARATGTVFITRSARDAARQALLLEARLRAGHRLLVFPEGTSTDGLRVLPFKPTLFSAFFQDGLSGVLQVQPVSLRYHAPPGQDPRFFAWWGDMDFAAHLLKVLAAPAGGKVAVTFHPPLRVDGTPDRKRLAARCAEMVREGHAAPLPCAGDAGDAP